MNNRGIISISVQAAADDRSLEKSVAVLDGPSITWRNIAVTRHIRRKIVPHMGAGNRKGPCSNCRQTVCRNGELVVALFRFPPSPTPVSSTIGYLTFYRCDRRRGIISDIFDTGKPRLSNYVVSVPALEADRPLTARQQCFVAS